MPDARPHRGPEALLVIDGVSRSFPVRDGSGRRAVLRAVDNVSLTVRRGETVALVGESGCGKSTLARMVVLLDDPDHGTITLDGTDPRGLRGADRIAWQRRVQMVFQDPYASLNGRMSAREIIAEPWTARGRAGRPHDADHRIRQLLDMVGLPAATAGQYPHELSGGQRQRLGIARALAVQPEVLVLDEPVSALDLSVQAQVLNLLADLQNELGLSYLFISHDLSVIRHIADHTAVMHLGAIVEQGATEDVFTAPLHPYTAALLSAAPHIVRPGTPPPPSPIVLTGEVPSPISPPTGCTFRTRCWQAEPRCAELRPELGTTHHAAACHTPLRSATVPTV